MKQENIFWLPSYLHFILFLIYRHGNNELINLLTSPDVYKVLESYILGQKRKRTKPKKFSHTAFLCYELLEILDELSDTQNLSNKIDLKKNIAKYRNGEKFLNILKKARKEWKDIWLEDRKNTERSKFLKNMFVRSTKVSGDSK